MTGAADCAWAVDTPSETNMRNRKNTMRMMDVLRSKKTFRNVSVPLVAACLVGIIHDCTVNPATGEKQLTASMPERQDAYLGASEHEMVRASYGEFVSGPLAECV